MELTTDQKGTAAETAIIHAAARIGVVVFKPISDGVRYDLIFDVHGALLRVQVKWARLHGGVVIIRCYSARRAREGLRSRNHTAAEVDALAAWCPDLDRSFLLLPEHFAGRRVFQLRISPTHNNQRVGINWADEFDFTVRLRRLGAVAQLGERLTGSQKATGSSPVGSISDHQRLPRSLFD
jgi:hypothetical protein